MVTACKQKCLLYQIKNQNPFKGSENCPFFIWSDFHNNLKADPDPAMIRADWDYYE